MPCKLACRLPQKELQDHGSSISGPPQKSSKNLRCNSVEEEEEALSESEIPDDSIRGIDFQTMYHSFMSGSVSEDSDGSKDNVGNIIGVNSDDNQIGNLSFSDSNNSAK